MRFPRVLNIGPYRLRPYTVYSLSAILAIFSIALAAFTAIAASQPEAGMLGLSEGLVRKIKTFEKGAHDSTILGIWVAMGATTLHSAWKYFFQGFVNWFKIYRGIFPGSVYNEDLRWRAFSKAQRREAKRLLRWLDAPRGAGPRVLIVYSGAGSGKSTLLDCIAHQYVLPGFDPKNVKSISWTELEAKETLSCESVLRSLRQGGKQALLLVHDAERATLSPRQRDRLNNLLQGLVKTEIRLVLTVRTQGERFNETTADVPRASNAGPQTSGKDKFDHDRPHPLSFFLSELRGLGFSEAPDLRSRTYDAATFFAYDIPENLLEGDGGRILGQLGIPKDQLGEVSELVQLIRFHPLGTFITAHVFSIKQKSLRELAVVGLRGTLVGEAPLTEQKMDSFCEAGYLHLYRSLDGEKSFVARSLADLCVELRGGFVPAKRSLSPRLRVFFQEANPALVLSQGDSCDVSGKLLRLRHPKVASLYRSIQIDGLDYLTDAHRELGLVAEERGDNLAFVRHRVRQLLMANSGDLSEDQLLEFALILDKQQFTRGEKYPFSIARARFELHRLLARMGFLDAVEREAEGSEAVGDQDEDLDWEDYALGDFAIERDRHIPPSIPVDTGRRVAQWNLLKLAQASYESLDLWDAWEASSALLRRTGPEGALREMSRLMDYGLEEERGTPRSAFEAMEKHSSEDEDSEIGRYIAFLRASLYRCFHVESEWTTESVRNEVPVPSVGSLLQRDRERESAALLDATFKAREVYLRSKQNGALDGARELLRALSECSSLCGCDREQLYVWTGICAFLASDPDLDRAVFDDPKRTIVTMEGGMAKAEELLREASDQWVADHLRVSRSVRNVGAFLRRDHVATQEEFENAWEFNEDLCDMLKARLDDTYCDRVNLALLRLDLCRSRHFNDADDTLYKGAIASLCDLLDETDADGAPPSGASCPEPIVPPRFRRIDQTQRMLLAGYRLRPNYLVGDRDDRRKIFMEDVFNGQSTGGMPDPVARGAACDFILGCSRKELDGLISTHWAVQEVEGHCKRLFPAWGTEQGIHIARPAALLYRFVPLQLDVRCVLPETGQRISNNGSPSSQ